MTVRGKWLKETLLSSVERIVVGDRLGKRRLGAFPTWLEDSSLMVLSSFGSDKSLMGLPVSSSFCSNTEA